MDHWIFLYQLLILVLGIIAASFALALFPVENSPLSRRFFVISSLFNGYALAVTIAVYISRTPSLDSPQMEILGAVFFFFCYALLISSWTDYIFELLQKPQPGLWHRISRGLSLLGFAYPCVLVLLPIDTATRLWWLQYGLYGGYINLLLVYLTGLTLYSVRLEKTLQDRWKRTTLRGTSWLMAIGIPTFFLDGLWPWLQVAWGWFPRAFNFQGLFYVAFNLYYARRWWLRLQSASVTTLAPPTFCLDRIRQVGLTEREFEIFQLIFQGQPNKQIAEYCQISLGTTKNHIYRIFQKTGASSRRELYQMFSLDEL